MVLPDGLAKELALAASSTYISPALLGEAVVEEFLRRGRFADNVARVSGLLKARRDAMVTAVARELPAVRTSRPEGGYFLWAELGEGVDAGGVLRRAEEAGVTFVPGTDFGGGPDSLRLAYSFVSLDEIVDGVARLAAALPVTA
jgi:DNA-binding transcriptional MocR family regulator